MISLIFARAQNRVIGDQGHLPWDLPDELDFYEQTTRGHTLIIGRRTYFDQPEPFPDRRTIVVTSNANLAVAPGVLLATSLEDALSKSTGEIFIAGGAALLVEGLSIAERAFETIIDADIPGDTALPYLDFTHWQTRELLHHPLDDRHNHSFTVLQHDRALP